MASPPCCPAHRQSRNRGERLGPYVIVRLLPVEDGEPRYRVRSSVDDHERALLESQIKLPEERPAKVEVPLVRQIRPRR
jgi:hypothetical protein